MTNLLLLRTVDGLAAEERCDLLGFDSDNQRWVSLSHTRAKIRQCKIRTGLLRNGNLIKPETKELHT